MAAMSWGHTDKKTLTVAWFSAGVSSAIATKILLNQIDRIIYTHIDDQHTDSLRFIKDCEQWFGRPIEVLQSKFKTVEAACLMHGKGYINGPSGANCTRWLKKKVRIDWEAEHEEYHLRYVWGMDNTEGVRAYGDGKKRLGVVNSMPAQEHVFPLITLGISKQRAHQMLNASGIKRPVMYDLGYLNNNCVGCVKGGMGYWNRIRRDFPEVFDARAAMERKVGRSCINGVFLDELDPQRGRKDKPICESCGILCEVLDAR